MQLTFNRHLIVIKVSEGKVKQARPVALPQNRVEIRKLQNGKYLKVYILCFVENLAGGAREYLSYS